MIIQLFILLILIYLYTNQIIDRHILIHLIILYMSIILVSNRTKEKFVMDKVSPKKIYNYEKWKDDPENTNNHLYFNFNIGCSVFKNRIPNKTYLSDYDFETTQLENKNLERLLHNYIYVNPESIEKPDTPPEIFNIAIPSPCVDSTNITKKDITDINDNIFDYNTLKAIQVMTGFKAILYTNRNSNNEIVLNNTSDPKTQPFTKNYNYGTEDEPNFIKVHHIQMSNPRKIINEPRTELTGQYYKEYAKDEFTYKPDINLAKNTDINLETNTCGYTKILNNKSTLSHADWLLNTDFANYSDCKTENDLDSNSYKCKSKQLYYGVDKYKPGGGSEEGNEYEAKAILNGPVLINLSNHRFKHLPSTLDKTPGEKIIQNSDTIDGFNEKLKKEITGDYVIGLTIEELFKDGRQGKNVYKSEIKPSTKIGKLIDKPQEAVIGVIPIQPWWYDLSECTTKIIVEYLSPEHDIYDDDNIKTNYSIRTSSDKNSNKNPIMTINDYSINSSSSDKLNFETPQIHQWFYLKTTNLVHIRFKQIDITVDLKLFTDGKDNDLDDQEYYFKSIWGNIKPEINNDDINYNTPLDMDIQKQCNFGTPVIDNNHISDPYKINTPKTISINIPKLPNTFSNPSSANDVQPIEKYSYGFNYFAFQSLGYLGFNITNINIVEHPNIFVLIYNKNQSSDDSDDNLIKLYNYNQFKIPINFTGELITANVNEAEKFIIDEPENKLDINCTFMKANTYFKNSNLCTININTAIDNTKSSISVSDNSIELNPALYSSNKFMIGLTIENIEYGNTKYDKSGPDDKKYTSDPINLIQIKYKDSDGTIKITPLLSIGNESIGKPIKVLNTAIDKCKLINLPNSNQNKHMISPKITLLLVYNEPYLVLYYMINNIIYSEDINTNGTTDDSKINNDSYKDILSSFIITHIGGIPQNGTIKNVIINTNPTNQLLKYDTQTILNIFRNIAIEKSVSVADY